MASPDRGACIAAAVRGIAGRQDMFAGFVEALAEPGVHSATSAGAAASSRTATVAQLRRYAQCVGALWEEFCRMYLEEVAGLEKAWTLGECPAEVLAAVGLKRRDVGVDLVAWSPADGYWAVQCKYRRHCRTLSWRDVATFDALCARTGPWHRCVVMTTSRSLRREGATTARDLFWGHAHFQRLQRHEWLRLARVDAGRACAEPGAEVARPESVNEARLRYFARLV